jgi:hypothetical protein
MADLGDQAIQFGANQALSRAGGALGVPLPDFQEINQFAHGDRARAARHFGGRLGGRTAGAAIGGAVGGPPGAWLGGMFGGWIGPHFASLVSGHGWNDNDGYGTPTVTVGDITDITDQGQNGDHTVFDPWTGTTATIPNFSNYNPNFTGGAGYSPQGPYSGGYQGLPDDDPSGGGPTMPNFDYSDQYSGARDEHGNPTWDPSADQNGDGRLNPSERRDASDWQLHGPSAFGSGVTNFMVGGSPVITGYRPAGGDMNQLATYNGRDWGG